MRLLWVLVLLVGFCFALGCEDVFDVDTSGDGAGNEALAETASDGGTSGGDGGSGDASTSGAAATDISVSADSAGVVWLHTDVSGWAQTASLGVSISGDTIRLKYDKTNVWPARVPLTSTPLNANAWVFVRQNGTWYAATWEWLKPGQTSKATSSVNGHHIGRAPLQNFSPKSGEVYGFMVSGLARNATRNVYERSNVVMVRWP